MEADGLSLQAWWDGEAIEVLGVESGDLTPEAVRSLGWLKHRFSTSQKARQAVSAFGPSCLSVAAWTDVIRLSSLDWQSAQLLHDEGVDPGCVLPCGGELWTAMKGPGRDASRGVLAAWIDVCRFAPHPTANIGDQVGAWLLSPWTVGAAAPWLKLGCVSPEIADRWVSLGHGPESASDLIVAAEFAEWARLGEWENDASDRIEVQGSVSERRSLTLRVQQEALAAAERG